MSLLDELTAERTHYPVEQTIVALSDDYYPAHQYGDITRFPTIADKLDAATIHQLMELARGGIGEPDAST